MIGSTGRGDDIQVMYVDLDGTLIRTDTLVERTVALVQKKPTDLLRVPIWLMRGRAHLKARVADRIDVAASLLPYRADLVEDLRELRASGCRIVLATAAPKAWADQVAQHLGLFDAVLASTDSDNLKGEHKLAAIRDDADGRPFGYAGDDAADLPILRAATVRYLAGRRSGALAKHLGERPARSYLEREHRLRIFLRLLRPSHWPKNLLVFVPALTSHHLFEVASARSALVAFVAFSLASSGGYVINDILDVTADRLHPTKRERPIAAGAVSMAAALVIGPVLMATALAVSAPVLSGGFLVALGAYAALTVSYSVLLRRMLLLDVLTLATLFVIRVVAGAEAVDVTVSFWLLMFSLFFFTSLALSKRSAELVRDTTAGSTEISSGRGYRVGDLQILEVIGTGTGLASVVVIALYTQDPAISELYSNPQALWGLAPLVMYWLMRIWILVGRGDLSEDPLLFSLHDLSSQATVVAMLGLTWWAL